MNMLKALLYTDDLAINDTTVTGAQERLQLWSNALMDSGLKNNVAKTEHVTKPLNNYN